MNQPIVKSAPVKPAFEIDRSIERPSFLPAGMDREKLTDTTKPGDTWRRYVDPQTQEEHDGARYFAEGKTGATISFKR